MDNIRETRRVSPRGTGAASLLSLVEFPAQGAPLAVRIPLPLLLSFPAEETEYQGGNPREIEAVFLDQENWRGRDIHLSPL